MASKIRSPSTDVTDLGEEHGRRLRRLAATAGVRLQRMHPQTLRHTFVTTMLDAGVDLHDVQIAARPAERVEYYQARRDNTDEWDVPEPISKPARLDVTISVRFTAEEIAAVRERARGAGMKPTTLIRQAVLDIDAPLNRGLLAKTFDRLRSDVEQLASVINIDRGQTSTPRGQKSTPLGPSPTTAGQLSSTPEPTRATQSANGSRHKSSKSSGSSDVAATRAPITRKPK